MWLATFIMVLNVGDHLLAKCVVQNIYCCTLVQLCSQCSVATGGFPIVALVASLDRGVSWMEGYHQTHYGLRVRQMPLVFISGVQPCLLSNSLIH